METVVDGRHGGQCGASWGNEATDTIEITQEALLSSGCLGCAQGYTIQRRSKFMFVNMSMNSRGQALCNMIPSRWDMLLAVYPHFSLKRCLNLVEYTKTSLYFDLLVI